MRLKYLLKTIYQLGFTQVALFALYKIGLTSGYYKRIPISNFRVSNLEYLFSLPSPDDLKKILGPEGIETLLTEADHIVDGQFRIFGSELAEIKLDFNHPLSHWVDYETGKGKIPKSEYRIPALNLPPSTFDLKLIWEPARFGWAFTLGRAYRVSGDEKYAEAFWRHFEIFDTGNPVNMGPHWMNGQEIALRLMVFVWAAQVFFDSGESTSQRKERLAQSVVEHADRIPSTLLYARAQNNNHLTSEAAGLYTAGLALPEHPQANKWRKLGIKWLNWSFENQIDDNGAYVQHSVNYQRLVLQIGLWVSALNTKDTKVHKEEEKTNLSEPLRPLCLTKRSLENLSLATRWLAELTDPISGNTPNLGSNDGAYIFPLANGDFRDFRPVIRAASRVFLTEEPFPADEMSLWFSPFKPLNLQTYYSPNLPTFQLSTLKPSNSNWAYLRVVDGNLRLAHADQLHLDLWWRGENITLDPGTYLYNAASPWDNPFPATEYHNSVTVNGLDQMTRASRFMVLDWAHGRIVEQSSQKIVAEHDGYRKLGVTHQRAVTFAENTWLVEDNLISEPQLSRKYCLHWLLPDWEWALENREERIEISLIFPQGFLKLTLHASEISKQNFSLVRAGELIKGNGDTFPTRGWYSPTYGVKIPALSLALDVTSSDTVEFISEFEFSPI
ncbi:MAG: alginate lyase family protein [Anaerolineales bacterium]|uniref:Alginate lyase family protein n=1 Tax=Candidatus Desulfolinea nitratireducens TaxID=2841698 RepID=A0A8J6NI73_9CHLR|nr:alginate lyase family protein [Candidatus Desulfolinea nitratireducens]MBL6961207.1 alginate lyase family protein [Anaerolineales bacterium]